MVVNKKIVVCHPAQQHSYRLATALKNEGLLEKYITTVYYKPGAKTFFLSKFLKGMFKEKAINRCCSYLDKSEVKQYCEGRGLLKLLALNIRIFNRFYNFLNYYTADCFAKKVAKYIIKNNIDVVVTYDDTSPLLFEILIKKAPDVVRILDMSAANLLYMRKIYDDDIKLMPQFAKRLKHERSIVWNDKNIERIKRENNSAQFFLVPSEFVQRSLMFSGIEKEKTLICPYGVDLSKFKKKKYDSFIDLQNRPLKFVYVGGIKELKGISYLFEAFSRINHNEAVLLVVGNADLDNDDIKPYIDRVEFTGMVIHSKMPEILSKADVFILPSLGEGLSLSALEAAACGLPLIVSENSGIAEKMINYQEGIVIPIQSSDAIQQSVEWFIINRSRIEQMGNAAREMASNYSWESYNKRIGEIFRTLLSS